MKRILASVIAITIIGALFSGCGNVDESKNDGDKVSSVSEVKSDNDSNDVSDDTSNSEDSSADSDDTLSSESTSDTSEEYSGYEDALRAYFDASNENDYEKMLRITYPDKAVDWMLKFSQLNGNVLEEELGGNKTNYVITDIVKESQLKDDELDQLMLSYDQIAGLIDKLEEYGGDVEALTDEQREELYYTFMAQTAAEEDSIEHRYKATEGYDVTVYYTKDGEPDEDYFYVYYLDGEGWKVNNTMRKYVKKAKQTQSNATAKSVYVSFASALVDIEITGADLRGAYIIGSDDSMNYNVPSAIDVSEIRKTAETYFDEISKYDYFVIIVDGGCCYTAVNKKDGKGNVGVYPISKIPKALNDHELETEDVSRIDKYSLDDLFEHAKGVIG